MLGTLQQWQHTILAAIGIGVVGFLTANGYCNGADAMAYVIAATGIGTAATVATHAITTNGGSASASTAGDGGDSSVLPGN
jgi:hypothetical protein